MIADKEGFNYPSVNITTCIQCELCVKVCPLLQTKEKYENKQMSPLVFALKNRNTNIQYTSASGGVFTELAAWSFSRHGLVAGAIYQPDFHVIHKLTETAKDAIAFRGSKYQQSDIGAIYREIRKQLVLGRTVLFSGTPCQVAGLKTILQKPYKQLYTCDLICHGVPSPKVFQSYLRFIEKKYKKKIININMRDKTLSWDQSGIRITFDDGVSIFKNTETNLFNCMYSVHYATRPSCHDCKFANTTRVGDITIGDYWNIKQVMPDFYDKNGVSVIIINTPKGKEMFDNIKKKFEVRNSNIQDCMQNNLYRSAKPSPARAAFFECYLNEGYQAVAYKFMDYGYINQIKKKIRWICHKLHLPVPSMIRSNIVKSEI